MYVARVLYPVEVLGPGKRVGIWFCGCPRRCKGCSNPELWEFQDRYLTTPQLVYKLVLQIATDHTIDGFTITGGDPMYQPDDFRILISMLQTISKDILVYTGYGIDELPTYLLEDISVLIDGEYIEDRNTNCILRGSDNQKIHVLDKRFAKKYETYLSECTNQIQNFMTTDGIISVGIHKTNFIMELDDIVAQKGIKKNE